MSEGEIVGLALTVALFAGAIGAMAGALLARARSPHAEHARRVEAAYAEWLAARWGLSRAARSFVAAFRALAAGNRGSNHRELRELEAQRAKGQWREAVSRLDAAEARLCVLAVATATRRTAAGVEMLRAVVHGAPAQLEEFHKRLDRDDAEAAALAHRAVCGQRRRPAFSTLAESLAAPIVRVIDRLASR